MQHICRLQLFIVFSLISFSGLKAQSTVNNGKSKVEIVFAQSSEWLKLKGGEVTKLIGNVQLKQEETYLFCDSAFIFDPENRVEAYSNVRINHNDSIHITGDHLVYQGGTKQMRMTGNVVLNDKTMTLQTSQLDYDLNNSFGYYDQTGKIVSNTNTLTSKIGYYYASEKQFFFKDKVELTNPDYVMKSDTLMYNTETKVAYFYGPTKIFSKSDQIFCENGWYNTKTDQSQFSKNAVLFSDKKMLKADSLFYDRKSQFGQAFKNITVYDSAQQIMLKGEYGQSNGKLKQTFVTQNCRAIKKMDGKDSLFLFSDTIVLFQQTQRQSQMIKAFRRVKIFRTNLQAICDSLVYATNDSSIVLFKAPILWSGQNQITADTIKFFLNNSRLDSFYLLSDAFVISKEKGAHYNQIKGSFMKGEFDSSNMKRMNVTGNCQSIYYAKEDSLHYIGINVIDCSEMLFQFERGELKRGHFITSPDATMHPLDELKPDDLRLKGFKWHGNKRPQRVYFQ